MNMDKRNLESTIFDFVNNDSKDIYFRINSEGKFSYINRAVENYGYLTTELVGKPVLDYLIFEDKKLFLEQMRLRLEGDLTSQTLESRFLSKSGEIRHFEIISTPVTKNVPGGTAISQGIGRDITEKIETQNILYDLTEGNLSRLKGNEFFSETSKYISRILNLDYVFIGKYDDNNKIKILASAQTDSLAGNTCDDLNSSVIKHGLNSSMCSFSDDVKTLFPNNKLLDSLGVNSYLEIPLINSKNEIVGLLTGLGKKKIKNKNHAENIFQLFKVPISLNLENMELIENIVDGYSKMLKYMDPYTLDHQNEVSDLSVKLGEVMGLSLTELETLNLAAKLHDIGKSGIPSQILGKPGKLTKNEFSLIKDHSLYSYDIIKDVKFNCDDVAEIVLQHHEKLDGSGYPNGLVGSEIHKLAKILTVADVFNAMANDRPYRKALSLEKTLDELNRNKGILFCPDVVETLMKLYDSDNDLFINSFCKRN